MLNNHNCIIVLGPTASGKTKAAIQLALKYNGEIISVDSRQVYKHLNIGTGKDLQEYTTPHGNVAYHLIDIVEPNTRYHVHNFCTDFYKAFSQITQQHKLPILCGGTGLYLNVVLKKNTLVAVPVNMPLRQRLGANTKEDLLTVFNAFNPGNYPYTFDTSSTKRLIRAIEVLTYLQHNTVPPTPFHDLKPTVVGIKTTLEQRKKNISQRLFNRLQNGLVEEATTLVQSGISHEQLQYFGLEYKYLSLYLQGKLSLPDMTKQLENAIHQYAKRQMTWFRKMEREGLTIHWLNPAEIEQF